MSFLLIGAKRTGSMIVELAFAYAGAKYRVRDFDYAKVAGESKKFLKVNPLSRVPVLKLPSGETMTESGAMVMLLHGLKPRAKLVPKGKQLPRFLRTLFLLTGEIYPTFTFADDPSEWVSDKKAGQELRRHAIEFRKELWRLLENELKKDQWMLGKTISALDFYVAVMTTWGPGRDWFDENTPKLAAIRNRLEKHPKLKSVFERHAP